MRRPITPVMDSADGQGGYSATLVSFGRALRAAGVDVSLAELNEAARALTLIDPLDRSAFYHALRSTLLTDVDQVATFDRLFEAFWADPWFEEGADEAPGDRPDMDLEDEVASSDPPSLERLDREAAERPGGTEREPMGPPDVGGGGESGVDESAGGATDDSAADAASRQVAFELGLNQRSEPLEPPAASLPAAERLSMLVRDLGRQLGAVRGYQSEPRATGDLDLRRSLGLRERPPTEFPRRDKRETLARVVLIVDVSRSMLRNLDQDFLFRFLFECVQRFADVRLFFFDTSVREVTAAFEAANVERMRDALSAAGAEWGAGTTIGACLAAILADDPFVVDYNTHCLIVSDGWDAGDLDLLRRQMTRLSRSSRSVIWLNPPASSPAYAPEVSGMQAALPYVDVFAGFASIDDLAALVDDLRTRL